MTRYFIKFYVPKGLLEAKLNLIGYCSLSLGPEDISDLALGFSFSPTTQGERVWKHKHKHDKYKNKFCRINHLISVSRGQEMSKRVVWFSLNLNSALRSLEKRYFLEVLDGPAS